MLSGVQFVDQKTGWALETTCQDHASSCSVQTVHSLDGGIIWKSVQMEGFSPESVFFINPQQGWVAGYVLYTEDAKKPRILLASTQDGGRDWIPLADVAQTEGIPSVEQSWISALDGWLLVSDPSQCTMSGCWGSLYRTQDGGAHWTSLQSGNDWNLMSEAAEQAGFPSGLQFVDKQAGWIPVERGVGGSGMGGVAITWDGGQTWMQPFFNSDTSVLNASVISAMEAWFVAEVALEGGVPSYLLHTLDAGQNWSKISAEQIIKEQH